MTRRKIFDSKSDKTKKILFKIMLFTKNFFIQNHAFYKKVFLQSRVFLKKQVFIKVMLFESARKTQTLGFYGVK